MITLFLPWACHTSVGVKGGILVSLQRLLHEVVQEGMLQLELVAVAQIAGLHLLRDGIEALHLLRVDGPPQATEFHVRVHAHLGGLTG